MSTLIVLIVVVVAIAFCIEIYLEGSAQYVYNCAILGAVVVFVGTLLLGTASALDFSLPSSYVAGSVTYFIVFFLLQRVSARLLAQQDYDVSKIWDTGTRLQGLFVGALTWPLMAPIAVIGLYSYVKKRSGRDAT